LEKEEFEIPHSEVGVEFMKKGWNLSPKVASAAFAYKGNGPIKGVPLTLSQTNDNINLIAIAVRCLGLPN
jgi:hypothetical protein